MGFWFEVEMSKAQSALKALKLLRDRGLSQQFHYRGVRGGNHLLEDNSGKVFAVDLVLEKSSQGCLSSVSRD